MMTESELPEICEDVQRYMAGLGRAWDLKRPEHFADCMSEYAEDLLIRIGEADDDD